jgi:hypothetical protein
MTSQSNDIAACEIGKFHMAFSHGQSLSYTGKKCENIKSQSLSNLEVIILELVNPRHNGK